MTVTRNRKDEYKVIVKLSQDGDSLGEVKSARVLHNGALLIFCRDSTQQGKAIRLSKAEGEEVQVTLINNKKLVRGVILGIPTSMSVEQIKENVKGVKVKEAKLLKTTRNGEKHESLSVMLIFDDKKVPSKVYVGYMCYEAGLYIPLPLRCFKCQKYGHVDVEDVLVNMNMGNVEKEPS